MLYLKKISSSSGSNSNCEVCDAEKEVDAEIFD